MVLVLGIDDAGRGPLIGPMVLVGVVLDKKAESILKKHPVKDSKQLAHPMRIKLAGIIKETAPAHFVVRIDPTEIDTSLRKGTNLNILEAMKMAEIVNVLNKKKDKMKVVVDCPSNNISSWKKVLMGFIDSTDNLEVICEHKADVNHLSVSAASILAKVVREEEVEKLKLKYGDFGSGYPSDPSTKKFLREKGAALAQTGIFRKTWATWKELFPEKGQATLREF